ncbi:hypothetical protein N8198_10950 [Gammaproteobacteria bacterium]|nr:hypothetical protein [Gammaproteobacteria bacterium]
MTTPSIRIIGVALDLGASRRGADGGPSAMRIAGLSAALERNGCRLASQIDVRPKGQVYILDQPKTP